jgi:hypothetical protein
VPYSRIVPGASIVVQSYGDFLDLNPHLHAIVADGGFFEDNSFRVAPEIVGKNLEKAFQYEVLKMLKKEGKINDAIIENLLSWRHTGFHVYLGPRIWPDDHDALERLARYMIRACFSSERMVYINMRIIAFIEDATLIQVILKHLGLWETKNHDPPPLDSFHTANELTVDESYSQIPPGDHWLE